MGALKYAKCGCARGLLQPTRILYLQKGPIQTGYVTSFTLTVKEANAGNTNRFVIGARKCLCWSLPAHHGTPQLPGTYKQLN